MRTATGCWPSTPRFCSRSQPCLPSCRALALKQITNRDIARVVLKEAGAGCMMGAILGLAILGFSCVWSGISTQVGATVAIALPVRVVVEYPNPAPVKRLSRCHPSRDHAC